MFRNVLLEPEQKDLLTIMVEASRNVSKEDREGFLFVATFGGSSILHKGLPNGEVSAYIGDSEALANVGLLQRRFSSKGSPIFDIAPLGYKYYEHLILSTIQPVRRVEEKIMHYLDAEYFQTKYVKAFQKWSTANDKLWSTDSERQLTGSDAGIYYGTCRPISATGRRYRQSSYCRPTKGRFEFKIQPARRNCY